MDQPAAIDQAIASEFLEHSCRKLAEMVHHVDACLSRLTDEQVWQRGGDHENAIGNLLLHLCGNMMQWIMYGVAGEPDVRQRELEFSAGGGLTAAQLGELFRGTVADATEIIAAVPPARLIERTHPQQRDISILGAIFQVVGHVQQHVGQIVLLTKQMGGEDLDLTIRRPRASVSRLDGRLTQV